MPQSGRRLFCRYDVHQSSRSKNAVDDRQNQCRLGYPRRQHRRDLLHLSSRQSHPDRGLVFGRRSGQSQRLHRLELRPEHAGIGQRLLVAAARFAQQLFVHRRAGAYPGRPCVADAAQGPFRHWREHCKHRVELQLDDAHVELAGCELHVLSQQSRVLKLGGEHTAARHRVARAAYGS